MKKNPLVANIILFVAMFWPITACVMSSENYRIDFDSINVGGAPASSTSYRGEDTVGEIATGESQSTTYRLKAGYQQMNEVYVSISASSSVDMVPVLLAITGGTADGSGAVTVKTDCPAGYQLSLSASSTPAMVFGAANFSDYSPAGALPDYEWSLGDADSEFGFTINSGDARQIYKNSFSECDQAAGTADGSHCWSGFSGTTPLEVARSAAANHPNGTQSLINYRAQIKSSGSQTPGSYSAAITATATAN